MKNELKTTNKNEVATKDNWYDPFDWGFGLFDRDPFFRSFEPLHLARLEKFIDSPRANLVEKEDHYELTMELPGFKKEEVEVAVSDGVLTVSAEHHEEKESGKDEKHLIHERNSSTMRRSFRFPGVSAEDIKAKLDNGVLEVTVPKTEKTDTSKKIEIE